MVDVIARPAEPEATAARLARPRVPRTLAAGVVGGAALGVAARAWMRLISDEPEFSWSGTIFIVLAFTIFGATQAVAALGRGRARRRRWRAVARGAGIVGTLPIFGGAGAIMLPTVVGAGLAAWRTTWRKWARAAAAVLAIGPIAFVTDELIGTFGWSFRSLAGFCGLIAVYATVIAAARGAFIRPTDGLRLPRWITLPVTALLIGLLLMLTVGVFFRTE